MLYLARSKHAKIVRADPAHLQGDRVKTFQSADERDLPAGRQIEHILRRIFDRQAQEVMSRFQSGMPMPTFHQWTLPMAEALRPICERFVWEGGHDAALRINRALGRKSVRRLKRQPLATPPPVAFDIFHPNVAHGIDRLVFDFCDSTNATTQMLLSDALAKLRQGLLEGLQQGEAIRQLADRVGGIFLDPMRAYRIARTEASRSVHSGQFLAAQQSGVVKGKKWLAKSDACPICLKLNGQIVGLDEDFAFDAGAGSYSHVPYPPRHPHCSCTWGEVLKDEYLPRAA